MDTSLIDIDCNASDDRATGVTIQVVVNGLMGIQINKNEWMDGLILGWISVWINGWMGG